MVESRGGKFKASWRPLSVRAQGGGTVLNKEASWRPFYVGELGTEVLNQVLVLVVVDCRCCSSSK